MDGGPRDLTVGSVGKKLLLYAIPIIAANLLQAIYSIVDMVIIGQFADPSAMSAVSMGAQITTVVLQVMQGIYNSSTAMSAQLMGAGRKKDVSRLLGTLLTLSAAVALILTVVLIIFAKPLLRVINTPEGAFAQAVIYLIICMLGTIFICAYNAMASVLRGVGDSKRPMLIVLTTVILNVALDLLFVAVFRWGVVGAALATILCQFISAVLAWWVIKKKTDLFDFKLSSFRIHREYLARIVKIGLPQSIQFFFATTSYLFLSGLVNLYGIPASAAAGAASRILVIAQLPAQGMMSALITHTAQNLAAGDPKRVLRGLRTGVILCAAVGAVICGLCLAFPGILFRAFTPDPEVIAIGIPYLRRMCPAFLLESMMFCLFGVLTGSGYTPVTMCCGILSAFVCRYSCAWLFSQVLGLGFNGIALGYPVGPVVSGSICIIFLLTGKWKKSRLGIESAAPQKH